MIKLAILVSGGGSNMQSIIDATKDKGILSGIAKVVLIISNNSKAFALERAAKEGIKSICIERQNFVDEIFYNKAILKELEDSSIDIICLAGYMRIVGKNIIDQYKDRILNIHPALLPSYGGKGMYGHHVHEAVVKAKEKKSGATVHLADENYDTGKMILQQEVPVFDTDTAEILAKRVLETEHKIYPKAIKIIIEKLNKEV